MFAGRKLLVGRPSDAVDTVDAHRSGTFAALHDQLSVAAISIPRMVFQLGYALNLIIVADRDIVDIPTLSGCLAETYASVSSLINIY